MLLDYRFSKIFFLIFILFILKSTYSQSQTPDDLIKPYCGGINVDEFLQTKKIDSIEIQTNNTRRWTLNLLRALVEFNSEESKTEHRNWYNFRIEEKYKKNFNSNLTVKFLDENFSCNFNAKIRVTGDLWWHIDWKNGNPISSIQVELLDGHINSITRFKLFLPKSREGNNEVFTTSILRELGFLAPRTFLVKSIINGIKVDYIFQEDLRKEFLENSQLIEGPILEGDERFTIMLKDDEMVPNLTLSRIINKNFLFKRKSNTRAALSAVSNLNLIFLQHHQIESSNVYYKPVDKLHINVEKFFTNKKNKEIFQTYEALVYALDAGHNLSFDDRRFYFDTINQFYLPIYYDGKSNIINDEQKFKLKVLRRNISLEAKMGAKKAIELIDNIQHSQFNKKLNEYGFLISLKEYKKLIKKIKIRLKVIRDAEPLTANFLETKKYFSLLDKGIERNRKLIFVNFNEQEFYLCNFNLTICDTIKKEEKLDFNKLLADVLSQRFPGAKKNIKGEEYIFVSDNINYEKDHSFKYNIWESVDIGDEAVLKFNKDIRIDIKEDIKQVKIEQLSHNGRALITGQKIDGWTLLFQGYKKENELENSNYLLNLNGCLTLLDIEVNNINIFSKNSVCEDSINLIKVKGTIKNVNIVKSLHDAFDLDFSDVRINHLKIKTAGNDCLDLSYGNYLINNLNIQDCGDKGISVGEKSNAILQKININGSKIAVAAKDSSTVRIVDSEITESQICFSAYRKKQEFSGAKINIQKTNCKNEKIFSQKGSKIILGS